MRKHSLLLVLLLAAIVTGCGGQTSPSAGATPFVADETAAPSPESDPTTVPSSTPAVGPDADASPANPTPSDVASCVAAEAEFPVEPNLPPVTAEVRFARG